MKFGLWMFAGSVASAFIITILFRAETSPDARLSVWLGMLGPAVSAAVSATLVERIYRKRPERLTSVMGAAFGAKMVFFGGYAVLAVKGGWVQPAPFAISFTVYFLALHIIEAFRLRRLFANT